MEDRQTPVLYLEMTEATPDAYAKERVGDVRPLPGVERGTWWRNVYRDRPDLPRELPEFDTLGVYECDNSFVAPPTPDFPSSTPPGGTGAPPLSSPPPRPTASPGTTSSGRRGPVRVGSPAC